LTIDFRHVDKKAGLYRKDDRAMRSIYMGALKIFESP